MKSSIPLLVTWLVGWLLCGCVAGYTVVPDFSGVVLDSETGTPLNGVAVVVRSEQSSRAEMTTREDGQFHIPARRKVVCEIPLGDRFISGSFSFSKVGYQTLEVSFGGVHAPGPLPANPAEIRLKRAE